MTGWLYDVTVELVGGLLGLLIFIGWAAWRLRAFALVGLGMLFLAYLLVGCAATKQLIDACRDGLCR